MMEEDILRDPFIIPKPKRNRFFPEHKISQYINLVFCLFPCFFLVFYPLLLLYFLQLFVFVFFSFFFFVF